MVKVGGVAPNGLLKFFATENGFSRIEVKLLVGGIDDD